MCISFNKVIPEQLISRIKVHLNQGIDVTHSTDMNFDPNHSAVIKSQENFKFRDTNYNAFAPKIYSKFLEFTI